MFSFLVTSSLPSFVPSFHIHFIACCVGIAILYLACACMQTKNCFAIDFKSARDIFFDAATNTWKFTTRQILTHVSRFFILSVTINRYRNWNLLLLGFVWVGKVLFGPVTTCVLLFNKMMTHDIFKINLIKKLMEQSGKWNTSWQ